MQVCFDKSFEQMPIAQQRAMIEELHRIAKRYMFGEQLGHTLQATALVNEAYLNLANKQIPVENEAHFIAIAARQMRRVLVDHARKKLAAKRDNGAITVTLDANSASVDDSNVEIIFLDKLLDELADFDKRSAQAFELKLFSSLTNPEIANVLGTSLATTERDVKAARAWIKIELANANG